MDEKKKIYIRQFLDDHITKLKETLKNKNNKIKKLAEQLDKKIKELEEEKQKINLMIKENGEIEQKNRIHQEDILKLKEITKNLKEKITEEIMEQVKKELDNYEEKLKKKKYRT